MWLPATTLERAPLAFYFPLFLLPQPTYSDFPWQSFLLWDPLLERSPSGWIMRYHRVRLIQPLQSHFTVSAVVWNLAFSVSKWIPGGEHLEFSWCPSDTNLLLLSLSCQNFFIHACLVALVGLSLSVMLLDLWRYLASFIVKAVHGFWFC